MPPMIALYATGVLRDGLPPPWPKPPPTLCCFSLVVLKQWVWVIIGVGHNRSVGFFFVEFIVVLGKGWPLVLSRSSIGVGTYM